MADQQIDMAKWRGLFEWSMKYQDGARAGGGSAPQPLDPEKKAWLDNALQEFMKDFADRMKEINSTLGGSGDSSSSLADKEALCDELMEIVENVDYARDLHTIGGLPTLLSLMSSPHPSLRWRAAEVAATCMANNPPVQRWFMEGGALAPLLALLSDSHPVVVTKALLGLSALVRHYDPGLEAFRLAGGFNKLLALLGCATDTSTHQAGTAAASQTGGSQQQQQQPDADQQQQQQQVRRLQRKVLALLQYVLAKHPTDAAAAAEYGVVPKLQQMLSDQDTDMRAASLAVLDQVVSTSQGWQWVQQHEQGLLPHLQKMQQHAAAASSAAAATEGDGDVGEEEQQLLHKLVQKLEASSRPQGCLKGLNDHIDLDPYQDGKERADPHTLALKQEEGQQQQQQSHPDSAAWAITAVPQPDMR